MNLSYLDFINTIYKDFQELEARFIDLADAFENEDAPTFKELRNQWRVEHQTNGARFRISDALIDYEESGDFKKQIDNCCLTNQLGLIEYTKVVISRLYLFCEENFNKSLIYYGKFNHDVIDLLDELYNNDHELNDSEFLKAVEIQFIDMLGFFESQFKLAYPLYLGQRSFDYKVTENISYDDSAVDSNPEPILLDYDNEQCDEIKKLMYRTLNGKFIGGVSEGEFSSYFEPGAINHKIKWKGYDLELAFLFFGIDQPITFHESDLFKIRIKNDPTELLCNTFLKKNGKDFYPKNLADNLRKARNAKDKNRIDNRLSEMLITIHNKFNK